MTRKKTHTKTDKSDEDKISEAMSILGKRSAQERRLAWGEAEYRKRQKEYGSLGGRPKGSGGKTKGKSTKAK